MYSHLRYAVIIGLVSIGLATLVAVPVNDRLDHDERVTQRIGSNAQLARLLVHALREPLFGLIDAVERADQRARLETTDLLRLAVEEYLVESEIIRLNLYDRWGIIIFSTEAGAIGRDHGAEPAMRKALAGQPANEPLTADGDGPWPVDGRLLGAYLPLRDGEQGVAGVFEIQTNLGAPPYGAQRGILILGGVFALVYLLANGALFLLLRRTRTRDASTSDERERERERNLTTLRSERADLLARIQERNRRLSATSDALREQEALFNSVAASARDAILVVDGRGAILYANPASEQLFGLDDFHRRNLLELVVIGESRNRLRMLLKQVGSDELDDGLPSGGATELTAKRRCGGDFPIEVSISPMRSSLPRLALIVIRDVSERHRAEARIRLLSTAIDQSPVSIFITDASGSIQYANREMARTSGYPTEELVGKSATIFESPLNRPRTYREIEATLREGRVWRGELQIRSRSGKNFTEFHTIAPVFDPRRAITHFIVVKEDVTEFRRTSEQLQMMQFALEHMGDIVLWIGADGQLIYANEAACRFYGYSREELLGLRIHDLDVDFAPTQWPDHWQRMRRIGSHTVTVAHRTKAGSVIPVEIHDSYFSHRGKEYSCLIIRQLASRARFEERMRVVQFAVDQMIDSAFWIGADAKLQFVNDAACRNLGYARDELLQMTVHDIDPNFPREVWGDHWAELKQKRSFTFETEHRRRDGEIFPVEVTVNYLRYHDREYNCAFARDITDRKRTEQQLRFLATHDQLTRLPNRSLLRDRLYQALVHAKRYELLVAVLFIDLDHFKLVNDNFGHSTGDKLLSHVGETLQACVREYDTIARQSGDEFVVVLSDLSSEADAIRIADNILKRLRRTRTIEGHEIDVGASIGVALYPRDGDEPETILKHADIAMYNAKQHGGTEVFFYTGEMAHGLSEKVALKSSLRRALESGDLLLHYQPQYDLGSGDLIGAEALIRWQHPELGLLPSQKFIPLAEEIGLIVPIGTWVLETVCAQNRAWQREGLPVRTIAVNLSARQLQGREVVSVIRDALEATGLDSGLLELELTESTIMGNPESAIEIQREIKAMGVTLSIDDFGTGYSSLSYLRRFPIDKLKIDRSFVRDLTVEPDADMITTAIISMAHDLGYKVVAEGVEKVEQLEFLQRHRCDQVQGYLYSQPLPADDYAELLRRRLPLVDGRPADLTESAAD